MASLLHDISRLSAKSVKEGWRKFKSHVFNRNRGSSGGRRSAMRGAASCNDFEGVSTAPMPPHCSGARWGRDNLLLPFMMLFP